MRPLRIALLCGLLLGAGCAPSTGARPPSATRDAETGRSRNVLLYEEIQASDATDAYQLVQRLRPEWLRTRGRNRRTDQGTIVVYRDHFRMGGVDSLRRISTTGIRNLQFLGPVEAASRLGGGHEHGAIVVTSL